MSVVGNCDVDGIGDDGAANQEFYYKSGPLGGPGDAGGQPSSSWRSSRVRAANLIRDRNQDGQPQSDEVLLMSGRVSAAVGGDMDVVVVVPGF